jgi:hypothetical protein
MSAFVFPGLGSRKRSASMIERFSDRKSIAEKILDNIIFLSDVFGNRDDWEIPDIPVLEMAKSFELKAPLPARARDIGRT